MRGSAQCGSQLLSRTGNESTAPAVLLLLRAGQSCEGPPAATHSSAVPKQPEERKVGPRSAAMSARSRRSPLRSAPLRAGPGLKPCETRRPKLRPVRVRSPPAFGAPRQSGSETFHVFSHLRSAAPSKRRPRGAQRCYRGCPTQRCRPRSAHRTPRGFLLPRWPPAAFIAAAQPAVWALRPSHR